MNWWLWVISGIGLLALELFIYSGFVIFFFGLSAICIGLIDLSGIELDLWQEWMAFGGLALCLFFSFGRFFRPSGKPILELQEDVIALEVIAPAEMGRGEMRGTVCSVRNDSLEIMECGKTYKVSRIEGITLVVGPTGPVGDREGITEPIVVAPIEKVALRK